MAINATSLNTPPGLEGGSGFIDSHGRGIATAIVLVVFLWISAQLNGRKSKLNIPIVLSDEIRSKKKRIAEYGRQPRQIVWKGYKQFAGKVFGIDTNDGVKAVIPHELINEMKSHPDLSFKVSIDNDMLVDYTLFGGPPEYFIQAIRSGLTPSLPQYVPVLHEIVKANLVPLIGSTQEWFPIKFSEPLLRLATKTTSRAFHSRAASDNDEWLDLATGYIMAVEDSIQLLKSYPPYLRWVVHRCNPYRAAIKDQWKRARNIIKESISEKKATGMPLEDPATMLDHLTSGKNAMLLDDLDTQLTHQMTLVAVGSVTTFASTMQCLYDLAAHPEMVKALRDEIIAVKETTPGAFFNKESMQQLKKMDSFMKESQRLSSPDLTTFQRAATADITLPDGTFIPKGTKLETATCAIHADDDNYENATQFDGLRFYRLREMGGEENKHMFVSVGSKDLAFGIGRHACPGRFLSNIVIKLILSEFLLNYHIRLPDGASRPANKEYEISVLPDPDAEIMIKKI